ncbi:hypothetical protein B0H63DRAFT_280370 [Podospora didyma]|uniref:DUF7729 domain-containing protein n=1 Tax=Podospora didyma TaxID=330526 RepID=A0AAE0N984_9PEZI|nr:hypothetical protein B0H63DRAFT_280370 [Podospora didyma]
MMASAILLPNHRVPSRTSRSARQPRMRWTAILSFFVCMICHSLATIPDAPEPAEVLEIDPRVPFQEDRKWVMLPREDIDLRIKKRAETTPSVTTTFEIALQTVTQSSSRTTSTTPSSPLPSPLDGGLSANFTPTADGQISPCPAFINSFLTDARFKQCYPLSLLLYGSTSFFQAQRSLVSLTQALDATCAANTTFCNTYLNDLARNLTSTEHCGQDYKLDNAVVKQAYMAMVSYAPVYGAGCLKDPQTSMYCFAKAATNRTSPTGVYLYYLPLNMTLNNGVPACDSCVQQTMNVYQAATANRKQAIAYQYSTAAKQVNTLCGPGFVNESLAAEILTNAAPLGRAVGASAWQYVTLPLLIATAIPWLL